MQPFSISRSFWSLMIVLAVLIVLQFNTVHTLDAMPTMIAQDTLLAHAAGAATSLVGLSPAASAAFTQTDSLRLPYPEDRLRTAVIDTANGYAHFGTASPRDTIAKIDASGNVVCTLGNVASAASAQVNIQVTVGTTATTSLVNTAVIRASEPRLNALSGPATNRVLANPVQLILPLIYR